MRTEIRNLLVALVLPPRSFFDAVQVASKLAGLRLSFAISAPCKEEVVQFAAALSGAGALNGCKDWLHGFTLPLVFVLGGQNEPWGEQLADALALCDKEDPQPASQTVRSPEPIDDPEKTDVSASPFAGFPIS